MVGGRMALLAQQRRRLGEQGAAQRPVRVWQSAQSSATGACSQSRGPRLSAWQLKQVWLSVGLFSIATVVEPCGLWQSLQPISPKRTGWVDGFWKSARFCR
jgi:hypothetical protein